LREQMVGRAVGLFVKCYVSDSGIDCILITTSESSSILLV